MTIVKGRREGQERERLRSEKRDPLLRAFARSHTSLTANSKPLPSKFSSDNERDAMGWDDEMEFVASVFETTFRNSRHVRNLHAIAVLYAMDSG